LSRQRLQHNKVSANVFISLLDFWLPPENFPTPSEEGKGQIIFWWQSKKRSRLLSWAKGIPRVLDGKPQGQELSQLIRRFHATFSKFRKVPDFLTQSILSSELSASKSPRKGKFVTWNPLITCPMEVRKKVNNSLFLFGTSRFSGFLPSSRLEVSCYFINISQSSRLEKSRPSLKETEALLEAKRDEHTEFSMENGHPSPHN